MANDEIIWKVLLKEFDNPFGVAGLMGNLNAESGLNPINLQDTYNIKLGLSDQQYTNAVDNKTYTNFVRDQAGYGLAQWTYWTRKEALLKFAEQKNKSVGDLNCQLEFLIKELKDSFPTVYNTLKNTKSVQESSDVVLLKFEAPFNAQNQTSARANMGLNYYNKFVKGGNPIVKSDGTYNKYSSQKLSEHFNSNEFDCHGSGCCSTTIINPKLIEHLENIRTHFNAPITITSAYRCLSHNSSVGGAQHSRHTMGDAADIVVKGKSPREVAQYAESIGVKGIGLYETTADGFFTHIDTRDIKSFWYGQACSPRTTFGGAAISQSSNSHTILAPGAKNDKVLELQKNINKLITNKTIAFSPLDEDGIYGMNTSNAVKTIQRKAQIGVDGIAGTDTQQAIDEMLLNTNTTTDMAEITASSLYVRKGPGTSNSPIGLLPKGTKVKIKDEEGGWGKILYKNSTYGWICLDYTKKI